MQASKESCIDKIVYIVDKDNDTEAILHKQICDDLNLLCKKLTINKWETNNYIDPFGMKKSIDIMGLIIPKEQEGALENLLLSSISENAYDKKIVDKSIEFVDKIKVDAKKYIVNPRLELKAKLSVVFAIRSPQKVFSLIDELIKSVSWEKYESILKVFKSIIEL